MTLSQFKFAVSAYVDREFTPKMEGINKWLIGIGAATYISQIDGMYNQYLPMLIKLGICYEDGSINIDKAYSLVREEAIKQGKVTQHLPIIGNVTFSIEDVDTLYNICKELTQ